MLNLTPFILALPLLGFVVARTLRQALAKGGHRDDWPAV